MPIFSNRSLDRMLKHISLVVGDKRDKDLRQRLSKGGSSSVGAEWEVAVLYSLSFVGHVRFPPSSGGIRNPDILFTPRDVPQETVIVEVTAISDASAEDDNPLECFLDEMRKAIARHDLNALGCISWKIGHVEKLRGAITLALPSKREVPAFFKSQDFLNFVKKIKSNPADQPTLVFEYNGAQSILQFSSDNTTSSGRYRPYRGTSSIKKTIATRLRNKHRQVKASNLEYPAIVVVCDNDCDAMRSSPFDSSPPSVVSVVDVCLNGGRQKRHGSPLLHEDNSSLNRLNGVFLLRVKDTGAGVLISDWTLPRYVLSGPYVKSYRSDVRYKLSDQVVTIIGNAFKILPAVKEHPVNAKRIYWYPSHYGGYERSYGKGGPMVKLSLLALQRFLSGEIPYDRFVEDYKDVILQFKVASDEGRMISDFSIEKCPDEDDDWVKIEFGEIDPTVLFKKHDRKSA